MIILKRTAGFEKIEIGELDAAIRLPMMTRLLKGLVTKCDVCGEEITDEYFVGGFKSGQPNLKLHERCAPSKSV